MRRIRFILPLWLLVTSVCPECVSAQFDSPQTRVDSARLKKQEPAIVAPYGDSLFTIYEKIGGYLPAVRARAITERLEAISEKNIFSLDSFRIENSDFTTDIMYGDMPLMSVSDADAKHEGTSREELAKLRVLQIQASVSTYKEEFSWRIIVKKTLLLLLLLIILSLIILGINKIFRWLYQLIRNTISPRLKGFRIGKAQFTNADKISILLIRIAQWIKVIVIIVVIYLSLPLIIYLIPSSRSFTDKLLEYTLTPLTHFIQNFIN